MTSLLGLETSKKRSRLKTLHPDAIAFYPKNSQTGIPLIRYPFR
ncbi:MAG: hypothetical protein SAJ12_19655 [Jaaginema sp. PMC 1079.18]|nr:hypothetical protein [Jaaginema sp. PMC 1080.18]MEC4853204.1 hypothetical protein [Jaaginema sp. PMC 1079.18]MEC4866153.1 hypothetical protein [Jaaginema sp. PMC 1078.18]